MKSDELNKDETVSSMFIVSELVPFRSRLPVAKSKHERATVLLDYLLNNQLKNGHPALEVFLEVLLGRYNENEILYDEIGSLLQALRSTFHEEDHSSQPAAPAAAVPGPGNIDWGQSTTVGDFYGRESELSELRGWIKQGCNLIAVIGMGGVGKTSLIKSLVMEIKDSYEKVFWRDLRNAPPLDDILFEAINFFSGTVKDLPSSEDRKIEMLVELMGNKKCIFILDNAEAIFQKESLKGLYLEGYEGYGKLIYKIGATLQQKSCLIITSREKPREVPSLETTRQVRSLQLRGLDPPAARKILINKKLDSNKEADKVIEHYNGNPLALKQVSSTIHDLFGGSISKFVNSGMPIFGNIRDILESQINHLSETEQQILYWLAIERDITSLETLQSCLLQPLPPYKMFEALETLQRRSLIEAVGASYTLQSVVMEYLTSCIIDQICTEISSTNLSLFPKIAIIKADAKEYIRDSQTRLILDLIVKQLGNMLGRRNTERQFDKILSLLKDEWSQETPNYAAGNLINCIVHLKGELVGYDFSGLEIRQAYLTGIDIHDVNFCECHFINSLFTEPFGSILSVTFSPRGNLFAAGTANNEIRLWQTNDNSLAHVIKGHTEWVRSIAFSPNEKWLASGSSDQTVRLWDVKTGDCLHVLKGHVGNVRAVTFSPDGKILASSGDDQTIRLWDVDQGTVIKTLESSAGWIWTLAFALDGELLICGNENATIQLWDTKSGNCAAVLQGHTERVRTLAVGTKTSQHLLASGSDDKTIRFWDLEKRECIRVLTSHSDRIASIAFNPDGSLLASGGDDQTIRIWDVGDGQCTSILRGHKARVRSVAFEPSGNTLISGGDDNIGIWDLQKGQCTKILQGYVNLTSTICFSPADEHTLLSGHYDHTIRLWDTRSGECLKILRGHTKPVWSVVFNQYGDLAASGSDDQTIKIWDMQENGNCIKTLYGHEASVMSLAFHPELNILASASLDQTVRIWDFATGQLLRILQGHTNRVKALIFLRDANILASGSEDTTIKLWNINTGECLKTLTGHQNRVTSLALSNDGKYIISGGEDNIICTWDLASGKCLRKLTGHANRVWAVTTNNRNSLLFSCSEDHTILRWDIDSGSCLGTLTGHEGRIWDMSINSSNTVLASCNGGIKLWDISDPANIKETRTMLCEKPYERTNFFHSSGLSELQIVSLKALGAEERKEH